ncbi:excalibur calcium-binding domain-containing protein [Corynebacterium bovis]|uniref:excalibur calcium-binding domain-containing protein n=1 Tax=Corynebacterium bovis TaxID=36808 RepID=UPI00313943C7
MPANRTIAAILPLPVALLLAGCSDETPPPAVTTTVTVTNTVTNTATVTATVTDTVTRTVTVTPEPAPQRLTGGGYTGDDSTSGYGAAEPKGLTPPAAGLFDNCSQARAAGAAPIYRGAPNYLPKLDRDNDGIACE